MTKNITEINDEENFKQEVLLSPKLVLVDFYADWCGPCRQLSPILEQISEELSDKVKIVKVNIEKNIQVATDFKIQSIPTLILFNNGEAVSREIGGKSKQDIIDWINNY
ncbi:thioredoxin [Orientia tsutsugamushi]|uniref:Thioredoxin n=1 Tax=Orientia tsutsugamushi TaxID=784 RepID=A0A2U3REL7_ORITS|nr:thioredoxin [Orientia tsutsugamushi]KJV93367.1 thioredoxin [Orientia tsutsugamushi str. UT76]QES95976.1 thioredoxin [Orientia tsutsugamushi]SPR11590.1 thiol reductase thioredoxin [Orientia tsutsugamushi]